MLDLWIIIKDLVALVAVALVVVNVVDLFTAATMQTTTHTHRIIYIYKLALVVVAIYINNTKNVISYFDYFQCSKIDLTIKLLKITQQSG